MMHFGLGCLTVAVALYFLGVRMGKNESGGVMPIGFLIPWAIGLIFAFVGIIYFGAGLVIWAR